MTPDQARELYATASTPEEAARLLEHRGRPKLGMLILTFRHTPHASVSANLFRVFARNVALGSGAGWFEPGEARTPESVRQVEAAFLWLADVFDRYARKQPPAPPATDPVDSEPEAMLSAGHAENTADREGNYKLGGAQSGSKRGSRSKRKHERRGAA